MRRPLAVALTGGIAAGKSEALQAFARHGAAVISTDDVVHRLYREDEGLQVALRERWGQRVFRNGDVDRSEIGRIVFADRAELDWLESELHPRVRAATDEGLQVALRERWGERVFRNGDVDRSEIGRIVFADRAELDWLESELHPRVRAATDEWLAAQTADVAVAEIPLLYETGGEERFDRVVVVTAPPEVREARRGALADREDRLVPEEEKVRRADFCYVNDGSLEELDSFVAGVLEELRRS